ncbi:MAG: hypothetical protein AB7R89_08710 [Dehalococcoidia bacterium]
MRVIILAALGGMLVLLAGCSGGRCGADGGNTAAAQQTSTPEPSVAASPISEPTPSASNATTATQAGGINLASALLTAADMPSGWDQTNLDIDLTATQPCGRAIPVVDAATAQQEIAFRRDRLGPYVAQRVMAYASGTAEAAMNATQTLLDECTEWKGSHGGRELTFRVSPSSLDVTGLGDQAFAMRMTIHGFAGGGVAGGLIDSVVSAAADLVVVRQGDDAFLIAQANGGVGSPNVDSGRTEQLARLAGQRLAAAIRGR